MTAKKIAEVLRAEIKRGDFNPGQRLPSASDVAERFGVTMQTAQSMYSLLKGEGIVTAVPRKGFYVRVRPAVQRLARNRLSKEARHQNRGWFLGDASTSGFTATVDVTISRVGADVRTADALNIEPGTEVVVRHRVMSADGVPVQIATSRFPASLAGGTRIEQADTGTGGVWAVLAELGHEVATPAVELVSTRMPDPEERELLQLADGVPVLDVTRVAYDAAGLPLEINDMVLAGDRYELAYEINID
jgi:GntR family transcriptional regulator